MAVPASARDHSTADNKSRFPIYDTFDTKDVDELVLQDLDDSDSHDSDDSDSHDSDDSDSKHDGKSDSKKGSKSASKKGSKSASKKRGKSRSKHHGKSDSPGLDPKKWFGEQRAAGGPGGLELVRKIDDEGRLVMRHRVSGGDDRDTGRHISRNRLLIAGDAPVSGMQFDTMVKDLTLGACNSPGSSKSAAKSRGVMFLFNDGTSTGSSDARGDIGAFIEISRNTWMVAPQDEYAVRGFIFRCETKGCGTSSIFDWVDLGSVRNDEVATLGMEWQADISAVSFWKDDREISVTYDFIHDSTPIRSNNRLEIRVEGANCTAGDSFADMEVLFDNVEVKR